MQKVDTKNFGVHFGRQVHNPFAAPVMQFWALGSMGRPRGAPTLRRFAAFPVAGLSATLSAGLQGEFYL